MDKLVERETAPRNSLAAAPALAVQFFLIPLVVVGAAVAVYVGFRALVTDNRTATDYLMEIRTGGTDRRWPAAYELSRLMADPKVRADGALAPALVAAFEQSKADPRVRRYLALAIGRLGPPLPAEAIAALSRSLEEPDQAWNKDWLQRLTGGSDGEAGEARISTIWALGSSGDPGVVPKLLPLYDSPDAGIRKMTVYALGALPGDAQMATLRAALEDAAVDIRWNAAVALARHGSADGAPVIRQMLDRQFVEQVVKRDVRQDEDLDPIADVMISGLRAAASLKDAEARASVTTLSRQDRSLRVRQAAMEALKAIG
ncbi:MAG: HEAT repeat domain-containing protein [Vicinamibacterales bacterium]